MRQVIPPNIGINLKVFINDIEVGSQLNVLINRTAQIIDITNKITGDWTAGIIGTHNWEVTCGGLKIQDEAAFNALETAFDEGRPVEIYLSDENINYYGQALITSFPLVIKFNDADRYNVVFKGVTKLFEGKLDKS